MRYKRTCQARFCVFDAKFLDMAENQCYCFCMKGVGISMGERIKQLRKELKMTQQEFADKLKINRGTLANYEIGKNTPIDAVILSICREFNVNEDWIRTGNGDKFIKQSRDAEISNFMGSIMKGDPTFKRRLISVLARLDESQWELLENMALQLSEEIKKADP